MCYILYKKKIDTYVYIHSSAHLYIYIKCFTYIYIKKLIFTKINTLRLNQKTKPIAYRRQENKAAWTGGEGPFSEYSVVQSPSRIQLFVTSQTAARQVSQGFDLEAY